MQKQGQTEKTLHNIVFIGSIHKKYPTHTKIIKYKTAYKKPEQKHRINKTAKRNPTTPHQTAIQRTKTAITDYALSNSFNYFVTLTLDKNKIDRYDYNKIAPKITYFLRRNLTKYLLVPEKHKDGAFHFHLLANIPKNQLKRIDSNNYQITTYTLGFSNARPIKKSTTDQMRIAYYIQKYITKDLIDTVPPNRKRYWTSRNLQLPTKEYNKVIPKSSTLVFESEEYEIYHLFIDNLKPKIDNSIINK